MPNWQPKKLASALARGGNTLRRATTQLGLGAGDATTTAAGQNTPTSTTVAPRTPASGSSGTSRQGTPYETPLATGGRPGTPGSANARGGIGQGNTSHQAGSSSQPPGQQGGPSMGGFVRLSKNNDPKLMRGTIFCVNWHGNSWGREIRRRQRSLWRRQQHSRACLFLEPCSQAPPPST